MTLKAIVIKKQDNLANLIGPGKKGEKVSCNIEDKNSQTIELLDDIPSNHKFAFVDIAKDDAIFKYAQNMGRASRDIKKGEHVHIHNIESNRGRGDLNK